MCWPWVFYCAMSSGYTVKGGGGGFSLTALGCPWAPRAAVTSTEIIYKYTEKREKREAALPESSRPLGVRLVCEWVGMWQGCSKVVSI